MAALHIPSDHRDASTAWLCQGSRNSQTPTCLRSYRTPFLSLRPHHHPAHILQQMMVTALQ